MSNPNYALLEPEEVGAELAGAGEELGELEPAPAFVFDPPSPDVPEDESLLALAELSPDLLSEDPPPSDLGAPEDFEG
jgi:hypothetical protein